MTENTICCTCVGEDYLRHMIIERDVDLECSYCGDIDSCIPLAELADHIHDGIQQHFIVTSTEPSSYEYALLNDKEIDYDWEREGEEVNLLIQEIVHVDEAVANDIQEYLANSYDNYEDIMCGSIELYGDTNYEESAADTQYADQLWEVLCDELKHRARFFSPVIKSTLDELFSGINEFKTLDKTPIVQTLPQNNDKEFIYRVRTVHSEKEVERILREPVTELGAPPKNIAASGRMNPIGVPVFYGALDSSTCISEVRPSVGSFAVLGKFSILRELKVLNLDLLQKLVVKGSYFDPESNERWGKAKFLRKIVKQLTKPVMPSDEHLEYLPTQAIAEYFAEIIEPKIDGIIFNSSQVANEGKNIVLFNHASVVEPYEKEHSSEVSVNFGWEDEDDYDDTISVLEKRVEKTDQDLGKEKSISFDFKSFSQNSDFEIDDYDNREVSLRLNVNDIEILNINGVTYDSTNRSTSRHVYIK